MRYIAGFVLLAGLLPAVAVELTPETPDLIQKDGTLAIAEEAAPTPLPFSAAPVNALQAYKLTFTARTTGSPVLEDNPRLHVIAIERSDLFWRTRLEFSGAGVLNENFVVYSKEWRDYTQLFYAPRGASECKLIFQPPAGPRGFEVKQVRLEAYASPTVNLNGDFSACDVNPVGWAWLAPDQHIGIRKVGGKRVFNSSYGSIGARFPLDPTKTYCLVVRGNVYHANEYFKVTQVMLYDDAGTEQRTVWFEADPGGKKHYFVVPENVTQGSFRIYQSFIEELSLTVAGERAAYESLKE
jgi:hypothetical protein